MSLFALPLSANRTASLPIGDRAIRYKVTLPVRKRKRAISPLDEADSDAFLDDEGTQLPVSTNPLSLTPAEIAQYKVAGLSLDKEIPTLHDFPHRSLITPTASIIPINSDSTSGFARSTGAFDVEGSVEQDVSSTRRAGYEGLRLQHFKALVAILHTCLRTGDIERALRAWTLLLRVQFKGEMIDIRSSGYWAIGAELLVRSESKQRNIEVDVLGDREREPPVDQHRPELGALEWGTRTGRERAVEYLAKLILEFPDNKLYRDSITAEDFWLSMLAIEIYGIQFQQRRSLQEVAKHLAEWDASDEAESESDDMDRVDYSEAVEQRSARCRLRAEDEAWVARDAVRQTTLAAIESLAARVDDLLNNTLYAANVAFIEIRAHISMYVGDLSVPESSKTEGDEWLNDHRTDKARKLVLQQRQRAYHEGLQKREAERTKVRVLVRKILENGGSAEDFRDVNIPED